MGRLKGHFGFFLIFAIYKIFWVNVADNMFLDSNSYLKNDTIIKKKIYNHATFLKGHSEAG